jgi:hypothetical protein
VEDVDEVVHSTRQMFDWREYVRRYPWACMGIAAAVGYLVVPKRVELISPDTDTLLRLAKKNKLVVKASPTPHERSGITSTLFTLAANAAVRGVVSYLGQWGGEYMAKHTEDS